MEAAVCGFDGCSVRTRRDGGERLLKESRLTPQEKSFYRDQTTRWSPRLGALEFYLEVWLFIVS